MAAFLSPGLVQDAEDRVSLISIKSVNPSPDTLTSTFIIHLVQQSGAKAFGRTRKASSGLDTKLAAR